MPKNLRVFYPDWPDDVVSGRFTNTYCLYFNKFVVKTVFHWDLNDLDEWIDGSNCTLGLQKIVVKKQENEKKIMFAKKHTILLKVASELSKKLTAFYRHP